jgi:putative molybdopterin biosynthesis protein
MDMHPAKVRYHLKQLEQAGMVALVSTRIVGSFVEKYYQATAKAFMINLAVVPQSAEQDAIILLGSHDLALETLAESLSQDMTTPAMYALPVGSLDGLIALRQGACHLAGCHLFDPPSGEYNIPYVRHLFPGLEMRVVTLVRRQQGLLIAPGNPLMIRDLEDLVRNDVRFINRKRGSGTRLWLDQQLNQLGINSNEIRGYDVSVNTHRQVARSVASGQANFGLAVRAVAQEFDLDFIPLFEERYDLVIPESEYRSDLLAPALDHIHSGAFRQAIQNLAGYQVNDIGQEILIL